MVGGLRLRRSARDGTAESAAAMPARRCPTEMSDRNVRLNHPTEAGDFSRWLAPAQPLPSVPMAPLDDREFATHPAFGAAIAAGLAPCRACAIAAFYDEPHRHYHARAHIREMFDHAVASGLRLSPAQALAVLFHDAVYVPGAPRGSNEMMSAQLMRVYCGALAAPLLDRAYGIIIDTADHVASCAESELVLDLDLMRLGAAPDDFARYSNAVFDEQRPLIVLADDGEARGFFESRRAPFFDRLLAREHGARRRAGQGKG
jgi:hypothetical protein